VIGEQRATKHGVEPLLDARNLHRLPSRAIRRPLIKEQPRRQATSSAKGHGRKSERAECRSKFRPLYPE
jgi:hypothetical protein